MVGRAVPVQGSLTSKTLKERKIDLLKATTTLMSRQLRSMVDVSLEEFVAYFQRWNNSTPWENQKEAQRISEIQLQMNTVLAMEGLSLTVNEKNMEDMLVPSVVVGQNGENGENGESGRRPSYFYQQMKQVEDGRAGSGGSGGSGGSAKLVVPPVPTLYPNGKLLFSPRKMHGLHSSCMQVRESSKGAIVIACLRHSMTAGNAGNAGNAVFQQTLLQYSTACTTSLLVTKMTLHPETLVMALTPSLETMEQTILEDIVEEFRYASSDFPSAHSERDTRIDNLATEAPTTMGARSSSAGNNVLFQNKNAAAASAKKQPLTPIYMSVCGYSSGVEPVLINAKQRISRVLKSNQSGPKRLEQCLQRFQWLFDNKEDALVERLAR